jgi:predicted metal-dependent HD superfamily phosphohydrolase
MAALLVNREEGNAVFRPLAEAYSSPSRAYHTLHHIRCVLDTLGQLGAAPEQDPALFLAAWFHDAVYDSKASDNEEQSARLAEKMLGGLGVAAAVVDETIRLILLTKTHTRAETDIAGQRLVDADLAILGEPPVVYDDYARAIRQEYSWLSEEEYRAGRARVLESFLGRPAIYSMPRYQAGREEQARANLRRELAELSMSPRE